MTHAGIECFLAICRHKTVNAAAQSLYITQPSLSARLKSLEDALGLSLFVRRKGSREMVLTPAGQEFYPLAIQYNSLMAQMHALKAEQVTTLRIACFNSLGTYLFPSVYKLFLHSNPNVNLQMQDMEIVSAGQSIVQHQIDLAFTAGQITDKRLRQVPAFSEPMVLICAPDAQLPSPVKLSDLPPEKEVYVAWCHSFHHWHNELLGDTPPKLCVSIMAQLRQFLEQGGRWAIAPLSVATGLAAECSIMQVETDVPLPWRQISYVTGAGELTPVMEAFLSCLKEALAAYPRIRILLP